MSTLKEKTIKSLFWKMLERGGYAIVLMVVQIVMARLLTPNDFGMLAIIVVFVNIGTVIAQSGFNTALIQASDADELDCSTAFWLSFAAACFLYLIVFVSAPFIAEFYDNPNLISPLRVLALMMPLNAFNSIQIAIVTRNMEMEKTFISTLLSVVVSCVVGIAAAVLGLGVWALVIQQLSYVFVSCVVLIVCLKWIPKARFSIARAKSLFGFGWKILVSGLLNTGYQSLYNLVIGKQFSEQELGLVSQGERYPSAITSVLDGAIQPVMLSAIAKVQDDVSAVKEMVRRAMKTSSFLVVPVMVCLALVAEPLTCILLGEKWLEAVPFIQMFCFVYAFNPIHTSNLQALNGMGRSDVFLKLEIIKKSYGVVIILFTAFVIRDVYAIVVGLVVSAILSTFVNAFPNKELIGYTYGEQVKDIAPIFAIAGVSALGASLLGLLGLPDWATLVLQAVFMALLYIGLSWLFRLEAFGYLRATVNEYRNKM